MINFALIFSLLQVRTSKYLFQIMKRKHWKNDTDKKERKYSKRAKN
jgi:hypothetical protein